MESTNGFPPPAQPLYPPHIDEWHSEYWNAWGGSIPSYSEKLTIASRQATTPHEFVRSMLAHCVAAEDAIQLPLLSDNDYLQYMRALLGASYALQLVRVTMTLRKAELTNTLRELRSWMAFGIANKHKRPSNFRTAVDKAHDLEACKTVTSVMNTLRSYVRACSGFAPTSDLRIHAPATRLACAVASKELLDKKTIEVVYGEDVTPTFTPGFVVDMLNLKSVHSGSFQCLRDAPFFKQCWDTISPRASAVTVRVRRNDDPRVDGSLATDVPALLDKHKYATTVTFDVRDLDLLQTRGFMSVLSTYMTDVQQSGEWVPKVVVETSTENRHCKELAALSSPNMRLTLSIGSGHVGPLAAASDSTVLPSESVRKQPLRQILSSAIARRHNDPTWRVKSTVTDTTVGDLHEYILKNVVNGTLSLKSEELASRQPYNLPRSDRKVAVIPTLEVISSVTALNVLFPTRWSDEFSKSISDSFTAHNLYALARELAIGELSGKDNGRRGPLPSTRVHVLNGLTFTHTETGWTCKERPTLSHIECEWLLFLRRAVKNNVREMERVGCHSMKSEDTFSCAGLSHDVAVGFIGESHWNDNPDPYLWAFLSTHPNKSFRTYLLFALHVHLFETVLSASVKFEYFINQALSAPKSVHYEKVALLLDERKAEYDEVAHKRMQAALTHLCDMVDKDLELRRMVQTNAFPFPFAEVAQKIESIFRLLTESRFNITLSGNLSASLGCGVYGYESSIGTMPNFCEDVTRPGLETVTYTRNALATHAWSQASEHQRALHESSIQTHALFSDFPTQMGTVLETQADARQHVSRALTALLQRSWPGSILAPAQVQILTDNPSITSHVTVLYGEDCAQNVDQQYAGRGRERWLTPCSNLA